MDEDRGLLKLARDLAETAETAAAEAKSQGAIAKDRSYEQNIKQYNLIMATARQKYPESGLLLALPERIEPVGVLGLRMGGYLSEMERNKHIEVADASRRLVMSLEAIVFQERDSRARRLETPSLSKEIPRCFIGYSWDDKPHKDWVRELAKDLFKNGVQTILDQWDLQPGMDLPQFMETSIRDSDYVVLVCTPDFARKANAGVGGTGYEKSIITGEMFTKGKEPGKFIPILRRGTRETAVPSYLKSKYYVDFTNDKEYSDKLEQLLRVIFQEPEYKRPALGTPPFLKNPVL